MHPEYAWIFPDANLLQNIYLRNQGSFASYSRKRLETNLNNKTKKASIHQYGGNMKREPSEWKKTIVWEKNSLPAKCIS
jgi:hypothetical protein